MRDQGPRQQTHKPSQQPSHQPSRHRPGRGRALLLLGLASGALLLLAAGLSRLEFRPGQPIPMPGLAPDAPGGGAVDSFGWLGSFWALFLWVFVPLVVVLMVVNEEFRRYVLRRIPGMIVLVVVMFLIAWALDGVELQQQNRPVEETPLEALQPPGEEATLPDPPAFVTSPPPWLQGLFIALLAMALIAVAVLLWRRFRPEPPQGSLVLEAEEALEQLRAGADLKDTVLRCYAQMSQLLVREQGIRRAPAMTPREFGAHLSERGWRSDHITRLTRLFEAVRYGARVASDSDQREAEACLEAIVSSYGHPHGHPQGRPA